METDAVLSAWDKHSVAHLKPSTSNLYRIFAKQLFEHAAVIHLEDLTRRHVEAWKATELIGCCPRTVNNKLRQARSVIMWAVEFFELDMVDPFGSVRRCRESKRVPRYLTECETNTLLDQAKQHSTDVYLGFALSIFAGLRKGEVAHARWEWLDWERGTLLVQPVFVGGSMVWEPKNNGSVGETPLHPRLRTILTQYRQPSGWILAPQKEIISDYRYRYDWKGAFKTVATRAGLPWLTPHVLRHTLASNMARSGYSMRQIQAVLRHSDPRSTAVYAHLEGVSVDLGKVFRQ